MAEPRGRTDNEVFLMPFWGIVLFAIYAAIFLWPADRIVRKAGHSGWWALVMLIPLVNIVAVWVFAFVRWPDVPEGDQEPDINAF